MAAAGVPAAVAGSAYAAATDTVVSYDFEPVTAADGSLTVLTNSGRGSIEASVETAYRGGLRPVSSRATQGSAVRFPAFDASGTGARAVIKVVNTTRDDDLAPGNRNFSWAADFRLDASSESHVTGSHDNGNNLVQRGLYNDTQFKLELDRQRPACRLRGSTGNAGAVQVVAPMTATADRWYSATCTRTGDTLTVLVQAFDSAGNITQQWRRSATSSPDFGTVAWAKAGTPMSIGGKLSPTGQLASDSDQFNGAVDNVALTFLG